MVGRRVAHLHVEPRHVDLMVIVYGILMVLVNIVPFVGAVGQSLLTPVFVGGFMIGCRAIERGEGLRVSHLFEDSRDAVRAFVDHRRGQSRARHRPFPGVGRRDAGQFRPWSTVHVIRSDGSARGTLQAMTETGLFTLLLVLVLATVFAMLNWFAPALVALRGVSAIEAMKLSFVSCLRNWVPFLLYSLVVVVAGIVMTIALVVVAFLFGGGAMMMSGSIRVPSAPSSGCSSCCSRPRCWSP